MAASKLDRRRRTLQEARGAADAAAATVARIEQQIATNADRGRRHESDLRAAVDRVAALKKAIKASAKEADGLRAARRAARERAAAAQQRAADVEGRYDEALHAELFRRAKEEDLAGHASRPATERDTADDGVPRGSSEEREETGQDRPSDETPGDDTARATAARGTAARAKAATGQRKRRDGRPRARNTVGLQPAAPADQGT